MSRITEPTPTRGPGPSHSPPDMRYAPGIGLARALGWFSIGLGAAELLAPRLMGELTGVRSATLIQAYGLREILTGVGILGSERPAGWMWGRVVGESDELGGTPKTRPVTPGEVAATIYRGLGLDPHKELPGPQGRPIPLVDFGVRPIGELF